MKSEIKEVLHWKRNEEQLVFPVVHASDSLRLPRHREYLLLQKSLLDFKFSSQYNFSEDSDTFLSYVTKRNTLRIQIGLMLTMMTTFFLGELPLCILRAIITETEAELPACQVTLPASECPLFAWQEKSLWFCFNSDSWDWETEGAVLFISAFSKEEEIDMWLMPAPQDFSYGWFLSLFKLCAFVLPCQVGNMLSPYCCLN